MTAELLAGLDAGDRDLAERALRAAEHAYAPYSGSRVGTALRSVAGNLYTGVNVENASFGLTMCSERVAVGSAVSAEGPSMRVDTVAVWADAEVASSCGACRQVLEEFGPGARVLYVRHGRFVATRLHELLPVAYVLHATAPE